MHACAQSRVWELRRRCWLWGVCPGPLHRFRMHTHALLLVAAQLSPAQLRPHGCDLAPWLRCVRQWPGPGTRSTRRTRPCRDTCAAAHTLAPDARVCAVGRQNSDASNGRRATDIPHSACTHPAVPIWGARAARGAPLPKVKSAWGGTSAAAQGVQARHGRGTHSPRTKKRGTIAPLASRVISVTMLGHRTASLGLGLCVIPNTNRPHPLTLSRHHTVVLLFACARVRRRPPSHRPASQLAWSSRHSTGR
jgi:hypothetical protein